MDANIATYAWTVADDGVRIDEYVGAAKINEYKTNLDFMSVLESCTIQYVRDSCKLFSSSLYRFVNEYFHHRDTNILQTT